MFDKIAEEFNRTSDVVVTGYQCFRKCKNLESKQEEIEDNKSKTGREKKKPGSSSKRWKTAWETTQL